MCKIKTFKNINDNDEIEYNLICEISGKPISQSNEYGMFCDDLCEYEENVVAGEKINNLINHFISFFDKEI